MLYQLSYFRLFYQRKLQNNSNGEVTKVTRHREPVKHSLATRDP